MAVFDYKAELWNGSTLSEILNPKIKSCSWSFSRIGGCDECSITLQAAWSDYSSLVCGATWKIKIKIRREGDANYTQVYIGTIIGKNRVLAIPEGIEFKAIGFIEQLNKIVVYQDPISGDPASFSGMSVSDILTLLMDTYIEPYSDLTGHTIAAVPAIVPESIIFDSSALNAIQLLGTLAGNYEWGINGAGNFYFQPKSSTVKPEWNFFQGGQISYVEYPESAIDITNRIYFTGANGIEAVLENANDIDTVEQILKDTTYSFGKATTYQDLIQTFTGLSRLKEVTLSIGKTGFTNIFTDGDMETAGVANWPNYGSGTVNKSKVLYDPLGSDHYLDVNPTYPGKNKGVHQQIAGLDGEYLISFKYRTKSSVYPVKFQIYNVTNDIEIFFKADCKSKSWITVSIPITVDGPVDVDFRWMGEHFYLDSVDGLLNQDDIEVWLVESATPGTVLKKVTISGTEIESSALFFKIDFTYDSLTPGTSYGIRLKRTGTLSNTSYYFIDSKNSNVYADGTLKYYNGASWTDLSVDCYFIFEWSKSQVIYDVRSERAKIPAISDLADAQLWCNSYLGSKNYPQKTAVLEMVSKTYFFEYEPTVNNAAIPLLSIRTPDDTPATKSELQINKISYTITDNGLNINLDLGGKQSRISDYLGWLQWQIDQLSQIASDTGGASGASYKGPTGVSGLPSTVTGIVVTDLDMFVDPKTGLTLAKVLVTWDANPSGEYVDMYEILRKE